MKSSACGGSDEVYRVGDRVLVCGHHPGTVMDVFTYAGRTTYSVKFDDAYYARIPPQTAVSLREEDLEPEGQVGG